MAPAVSAFRKFRNVTPNGKQTNKLENPLLIIASIHLDEKSKKAPIYSLHVHPDGTRLATGAQGKGKGCGTPLRVSAISLILTIQRLCFVALHTRRQGENLEYGTDH